MIIYRQYPFRAGDVITPLEINANQAAVAAEINGGIDRDNIPTGVVTSAKLGDGGLAGSHRDFVSVSNTTTGALDTSSSGSWVPVAELPGVNLYEPCRVLIDAQATLELPALTGELAWALAILVDGVVICQTGAHNSSRSYDSGATPVHAGMDKQSQWLRAAPLLGAGPRRVEVAVCSLSEINRINAYLAANIRRR